MQINFSNLNSAAAMPMIIAGDLFRVQFKTKFSYFDHHCILTAVVADLFRLWFKLWSTEVSKAILDT